MLKQILKIAAHRSGAIQLLQRLNRNRVRILTYHRFPREHGENFDRQCDFLATHYNVVSLLEAARRLGNKEPVHNLAVITIDDGYADVYEVAFPILRKHQLPATLFVTTGFINRSCWMPGDRVREFFAHARRESLETADDHGEVHLFRTKDPQASDRLRALLKRVSNSTRARILSEMDGGQPQAEPVLIPAAYRPCTWNQLREMAAGGITMGAHTVTHPILSRLGTKEETDQEILDSKACLERELGDEVSLFAYPNGTPQDISLASLDCARKHFLGAVTAVSGLNAPGDDLHQLLRLPCDPDIPVPQLARMLAGPLPGRGASHRSLQEA